MKYFLHDSNAFQDEKISELFMEFGFEGLGLFYTILEKLAMQEKPIKTDVLKMQLFVGRKLERCWKFLESSGLISSNNGETFNENLLKFSEKYQVKKDKNRERITEWRKNQAFADDVTRYNTVTERVRNSPKDKISKDKISKVKSNTPSAEGDTLENEKESAVEFVEKAIKEADNTDLNADNKKASQTVREIFDQGRRQFPGAKRGEATEWENFQKKHGKRPDFKLLPAAILSAIKSQIEQRVLDISNPKYIPHFQTWINNCRWEMEVSTPARVIPINQQSQISSRLELANKVSNMFQYDEQGKMI